MKFDVVIVGAGLSGIGAAWHLQHEAPDRSFVILEGREAIGGTWDLFRYPGIRSDSDMYTLGYSFKPWTEEKAIADGPSIWKYVHETAAEYGIDKHVRRSLDRVDRPPTVAVGSDLEEVLGVSNRIVVLAQGKQAGILNRADANDVSVMELATI